MKKTIEVKSKIGFGCAGVTSLNDRKAALDLLEHAYSEGIRHFDVARLYGMGRAESIVGEFAKNKRDKITITTKFGLNPPASPVGHGKSFSVMKGIAKKIPFIHGMAKKAIHARIEPVFTLENARKSLEKSLSELGTDYVDYYLLHEASWEDSNQEDVIDFLARQVEKGTILHYGLGTASRNILEAAGDFHSGYEVFQFDNDLFTENVLRVKNPGNRLFITHSAFRPLKKVESLLKNAGAPILERLRGIGLDASNSSHIAGLLLANETALNPSGITLFASTSKAHITGNLKALSRLEGHGGFKDLLGHLKNADRP